jgi:hypothetical protein
MLPGALQVLSHHIWADREFCRDLFRLVLAVLQPKAVLLPVGEPIKSLRHEPNLPLQALNRFPNW